MGGLLGTRVIVFEVLVVGDVQVVDGVELKDVVDEEVVVEGGGWEDDDEVVVDVVSVVPRNEAR